MSKNTNDFRKKNKNKNKKVTLKVILIIYRI